MMTADRLWRGGYAILEDVLAWLVGGVFLHKDNIFGPTYSSHCGSEGIRTLVTRMLAVRPLDRFRWALERVHVSMGMRLVGKEGASVYHRSETLLVGPRRWQRDQVHKPAADDNPNAKCDQRRPAEAASHFEKPKHASRSQQYIDDFYCFFALEISNNEHALFETSTCALLHYFCRTRHYLSVTVCRVLQTDVRRQVLRIFR